MFRGDALPGIDLDIVELSGGSGAGGTFRVGDTLAVRFTVTKTDGSPWGIAEFGSGRILVSGPTTNYQPVIAEQADVVSRATANADGSFTYTFGSPIPANYLAPYNDTAAFGAGDGELSGQALLDGTYTVGLYTVWNYTLDGASMRDAGNATEDFLLGPTASALEPRAVVSQGNCNQCHESLRAHGDMRRDVTLCLLCHTAGAEDKNEATVAGGTPGVSVDFRVMIHKIHNANHLPSVLGVATNANGSRNYAATQQPYEIVGYGNTIHDYSEIGFPMMPSAYVAYTYDQTGTTYTGARGNGPMPRDVGYSALTTPQKLLEDRMRAGVVACASCHGDPDGAGPLPAPAQGDQIYTNQTRQACGSCHDDVDWTRDYTANGLNMPPQANDSLCTLCHEAPAIEAAHTHPYLNTTLNTGVNLEITAVGGGSGTGGKHEAGDPIQVTFGLTNDTATALQVHYPHRMQVMAVGPSMNPQWLMPNVSPFDTGFRKVSGATGSGTISTPVVGPSAIEQTIAVVFTSSTTFDVVGSVSAPVTGQAIGSASNSTAAVDYGGVQFTVTQGTTAFANHDRFYFEAVPTSTSYTVSIPRDITFERLGAATGSGQALSAGNSPVYWGRQVVYERTALVGSAASTGLSSAAMNRYVVVDQSTLSGVAVGDRVVIGAGSGTEEYAQVSYIQTTDARTGADLGAFDRFYFNLFLRYDHAAGTTIQEVTLSTKKEGRDYTVAATGATGITLLAGQFTASNPVLMSYRSHARFGWYRAPGDTLQAVYTPGTGDSDDIGASEGDWTALPIVDGTYRVGMYCDREYSVTPAGAATALVAQTNLATDNTTYRMISPPTNMDFLFGTATEITTRQVIADEANCNKCHGEILAHGNGRRGLDTCLLCHVSPGIEDAPLYNFNGWYIPQSPATTEDFRTMLHKVHMGKDLANAASYVNNGIFLGVPYPVHVGEIGFPVMNGGTRACTSCHGETNEAWLAPADRDHPNPAVAPTKEWKAACGSCHDSSAATAHIESQSTSQGESCDVCHGPDKEHSVERAHFRH